MKPLSARLVSFVDQVSSLAKTGHNIAEIERATGLYHKQVVQILAFQGIAPNKYHQSEWYEAEQKFRALLAQGVNRQSAMRTSGIPQRRALRISKELGYQPMPTGAASRLPSDIISARVSEDMTLIGTKDGEGYVIQCNKCQSQLVRQAYYLDGQCPKCKTSSYYLKTEGELAQFIQNISGESPTTTKIHSPDIHPHKLEIDVYLPSRKIGIEYCGLYWHREYVDSQGNIQNGFSKHATKLKVAQSSGIRLITVFENEWRDRRPQVENYLRSVLGTMTITMGARECTVKEIPDAQARQFLEESHIQGPGNSLNVAFGLFYGDDLVGVMSAGQHHRKMPGKAPQIVLKRLAFKSDVRVQGGASKLLSALKAWSLAHGYTSIISWSDNRWSEGRVYQAMGFILDANIKPDYYYTLNKKLYSKQSLKKNPAKDDMSLTEYQLRQAQGYSRIWDCGKKRWLLQLK